MNGHFTTEIGRMRCEEMVDRGIRYQKVLASQRRQREQKVLAPRRKAVSFRRLATAVLSMMFLVLLSSAALAYPANPDPGTGLSHTTDLPATGGHVVETAGSSADVFTWIAVAVAVGALALAAIVVRHRRPVAVS